MRDDDDLDILETNWHCGEPGRNDCTDFTPDPSPAAARVAGNAGNRSDNALSRIATAKVWASSALSTLAKADATCSPERAASISRSSSGCSASEPPMAR